MQKGTSSNLRKLRFMQKSEVSQKPQLENVAEQLLTEDVTWVYKGYEDIHKIQDEKDAKNKPMNLKIRYISR